MIRIKNILIKGVKNLWVDALVKLWEIGAVLVRVWIGLSAIGLEYNWKGGIFDWAI